MAYVQLSRFVLLIQAVLAAGLAAGAVGRGMGGRRGSDAAGSALLLLGVAGLAGVAVAGWVLFYLGLWSRIPVTPGAMCIFGVTRAFPPSVRWVEAGFPGVLVLAGAGAAAYLLEHRAGDPGSPAVRVVLGAVAVVSLVHAAAGLWAWHRALNPAAGRVLTVSCCTTVFDVAAAGRTVSAWRGLPAFWVWGALAVAAAGLAVLSRPLPFRGRGLVWAAAALAGVVLAAAGPAVLLDRWGPAMMGLIDHRCPYCFLQRVPVGPPAALLGSFGLASLLWGAWVRCFGAWRPGLRREGLPMEAALARTALWLGLSTVGMLAAYAVGRGIVP